MEESNLLSLSSLSYETKRFRMRRIMIKPGPERTDSEIAIAVEILQVKNHSEQPILVQIFGNWRT